MSTKVFPVRIRCGGLDLSVVKRLRYNSPHLDFVKHLKNENKSVFMIHSYKLNYCPYTGIAIVCRMLSQGSSKEVNNNRY